MEATKKLNGKAVGKWLSNNAIIMMMLAVSLIVGIMHPNFFSGTNMINLFKNVSIRYIIALGISGCLITTGNDLSAGRLAGFAACLACIFAQTEGAGEFGPEVADFEDERLAAEPFGGEARDDSRDWRRGCEDQVAVERKREPDGTEGEAKEGPAPADESISVRVSERQ